VGIENPAQNDASGPRHARVQLTRYLHDLQQVAHREGLVARALSSVTGVPSGTSRSILSSCQQYSCPGLHRLRSVTPGRWSGSARPRKIRLCCDRPSPRARSDANCSPRSCRPGHIPHTQVDATLGHAPHLGARALLFSGPTGSSRSPSRPRQSSCECSQRARSASTR